MSPCRVLCILELEPPSGWASHESWKAVLYTCFLWLVSTTSDAEVGKKECKPDFSLICQDSWIKIYSLPPNAHMHVHIWSCLAHSCSGSCLSSCQYSQWHNHLIYFFQLNPKATDRFLLRVLVMPKATIPFKWSWSQNLLLCFFLWNFFKFFIGTLRQCIMIKISLTI